MVVWVDSVLPDDHLSSMCIQMISITRHCHTHIAPFYIWLEAPGATPTLVRVDRYTDKQQTDAMGE